MPTANIKQQQQMLQKQTQEVLLKMDIAKRQKQMAASKLMNDHSPRSFPEHIKQLASESLIASQNADIQDQLATQIQDKWTVKEHSNQLSSPSHSPRLVGKSPPPVLTAHNGGPAQHYTTMGSNSVMNEDLQGLSPLWMQNRDSSTLNKEQAHKEFDAFVHAAARQQESNLGNTQLSSEAALKYAGSPRSGGSGGDIGTAVGAFGADGRKSLHLATTDQMNFLIASNYSTAKSNLNQFKQQVVPRWPQQ